MVYLFNPLLYSCHCIIFAIILIMMLVQVTQYAFLVDIVLKVFGSVEHFDVICDVKLLLVFGYVLLS